MRVFTSERCLEHRAPAGYDESPARLEGVLDRLRAEVEQRPSWTLEEVAGHDGARDAVLALHDPAYVEAFRRSVERGDSLFGSPDNPISEGSWRSAWAAAETTLAAADAVVEAGGKSFAAVRPPGHHAEHALAMGFCFFGNAAAAAEHLIRRHGMERVAIYDFDVHHGNGTQHLVEERADIFFASAHQFPFYPGTGAASERGIGAGEGYTLNCPLPAGTGDEGYAEVTRNQILPALRSFRPDALILSAGFDAWRGDPLGGMKVSRQGFMDWGIWLGELAEDVCEGRVLTVLEGGYDLGNVPDLVARHLAALEGERLPDPDLAEGS